VADPIYIGVDGPVQGANLVRALGYHGLSSGLVRSDARWQIEVNSPREGGRTFLATLGRALAAWNGGGRGGEPARLHDRSTSATDRLAPVAAPADGGSPMEEVIEKCLRSNP
jgi:hypothetical protein